MKQLFLGGTRSGKSLLAEQAASASGCSVIYIATAQLRDDEMRARADKHQRRRPDNWRLIEEPIALAEALQQNAQHDHCLLIDCITLWMSHLLERDEEVMRSEQQALFDLLPTLDGHIIFVSSEVGLGVMPANALARQYADYLGELNQTLAQYCDRVTLAAAGLPMLLKDETR